MKYKLLLVVLVGFFIISFVSSAPCGATPTNLCTIGAGTTTFNGSNFTLIGGLNGAIQINANNSILDCNNSWIIGNMTENFIGIGGNQNFHNITIKNCHLTNYTYPYKGQKWTNLYFYNNTASYSPRGMLVRDVNDSFFYGNTFYNISGRAILNFENVITKNNQIYENNFIGGNLQLYDAYNYTVRNNYFINITKDGGISGQQLHNSNISGNIFNNMTRFEAILLQDGCTNNLIEKNIINLSSVGIWIRQQTTGTNITSNVIDRLITNFDGMNVGILLEGQAVNSNVSYNNITNYGTAGILSLGSNNTYITNNILNAYPISKKIGSVNDGHYPTGVGIQITELFKTWTNDLSETNGDNVTTKFYAYQSYNVTIDGNIIDNNNQIYLYTSGANNLVHDITGYQYLSWYLPYLTSREEYFISPYFNNLSTVNNSFVYQNTLFQGYQVGADVGKQDINYQWFNDYMYFESVNWTWNYNATTENNKDYPNFKIAIYNLTNVLIYNTNGTVLGSTTISANDGNINITLAPNNASYVLNNFNVTEGVTRANSPSTFSVSTFTSKHITNTLAEPITVPVIFNVYDCNTVGNIRYTSDDGSQTSLYQRGDYTCNNNQVTLTLTLDSSTSSNELEIEYACSSYVLIGYRLILIFSALMLLAYVILYARIEQLSMQQILMLFIVIIVGVVLWQVTGQLAGSSCGVIAS